MLVTVEQALKSKNMPWPASGVEKRRFYDTFTSSKTTVSYICRVYDCWQPCRDSRVKVPGDRGTLSEMRACAWPLIAGTFKACIHGNATVIGVADERWSDGSHNLVPCLLQVRLSARFQPSCCTGNTTWFAGKPNCVDRMSRKLILSLYDTSHRTSRIK